MMLFGVLEPEREADLPRGGSRFFGREEGGNLSENFRLTRSLRQ